MLGLSGKRKRLEAPSEQLDTPGGSGTPLPLRTPSSSATHASGDSSAGGGSSGAASSLESHSASLDARAALRESVNQPADAHAHEPAVEEAEEWGEISSMGWFRASKTAVGAAEPTPLEPAQLPELPTQLPPLPTQLPPLPTPEGGVEADDIEADDIDATMAALLR